MNLRIVNSLKLLVLSLSIIMVVSCTSQRPYLYPNEHLATVGQEQANKDIDKAIVKADKLDLNSKWKNEAIKTTVSTTAGAGSGATVGAIGGNTGLGAVSGGAGSFISSSINWMFSSNEPTHLYKNYVNLTLQKQGYQVAGWK
jgi:hypothetical protein